MSGRPLLSLTVLLFVGSVALADIRIGVIASSTGPTGVVGMAQKNTGALLPPAVGGHEVSSLVLDDASDPTHAVTNVRKLIGPTTTPAAPGMLDVVAESKVPRLTTVGSSAVIQPLDDKKRWFFKTAQNDDLIAGPA